MPIGAMPVIPAVPLPVQLQDLPVLTMEPLDINSLPEMERFTVELTKDIYGLGITIAGYVCEKGKLETKDAASRREWCLATENARIAVRNIVRVAE